MPFRAKFLLAGGAEVRCPIFLDACRLLIERATRWRPPALSGAILTELEDRGLLLSATNHVYGSLTKSDVGVFHVTDDDGREWGIPARHVIAWNLEDPLRSRSGGTARVAGFLPPEAET
jgi:hypothetical protein